MSDTKMTMHERMAWVRSHKKPSIKKKKKKQKRARSVATAVRTVASAAYSAASATASVAKAVHDTAVDRARLWYHDHLAEQQRQDVVDRVHGKHRRAEFARSQTMLSEEQRNGLETNIDDVAQVMDTDRRARATRNTRRDITSTGSAVVAKAKKSIAWRNDYDREDDSSQSPGRPTSRKNKNRASLEDVRFIPNRRSNAAN